MALRSPGSSDPLRPHSGKFLLRLDPALHAQVAARAKKQRLSLNTLVLRAIAWYLSTHGERKPPHDAV